MGYRSNAEEEKKAEEALRKEAKMRAKKLLAAFLLGVGLCFIPALGHGEVILGRKVNPDAFLQYGEEPWWFGIEALKLETELLRAQIEYMMYNPTTFYFYPCWFLL